MPSKSTSRSSSLDRSNASPPVHSESTISRPTGGKSLIAMNVDKTVTQKRKSSKTGNTVKHAKGNVDKKSKFYEQRASSSTSKDSCTPATVFWRVLKRIYRKDIAPVVAELKGAYERAQEELESEEEPDSDTDRREVESENDSEILVQDASQSESDGKGVNLVSLSCPAFLNCSIYNNIWLHIYKCRIINHNVFSVYTHTLNLDLQLRSLPHILTGSFMQLMTD